MFTNILKKLIGDPNEREIKKLLPTVEHINQLEEKYQKDLNDFDLPGKTEELKERFKKGETLDELLPEAFALVKNACRRQMGKKWLVRGKEKEWDMIPFDVQLIGGMVLHQGKIAEMKTGEGKTLVCTLPAYLNALTGKGVYVVTVNEYLAQRDSEWMSGIFKSLGLKVGVILNQQAIDAKKEAYMADITYGTNNEYGFDYLRDNMATNPEHIFQKNQYYAIVDEVDSILIDEARTPLIISAPAEESTSKYKRYADYIGQLKENQDYNIDEKLKTATLTEAGILKMEKILGVDNIYTDKGFEEVHHIEQALKAHTVYKIDIDYVVKDNEILIVDEFTGRLMPGRRYSEGLHQAIEAKENVEIKRESRTLATISFQNYFRLFEKLAGMTGTALTEAEEFAKIYNLETLEIPTNKKMIRKDHSDAIYKNEKGKFLAVTKKAKELHKKGQPVLIGTISIERSEILSKLLKLEGVPHSVLNAKYHEKEAEIVAKAGEKGMVTIATNMAGRGTDIKLGDEVKNLGGLFILGTERHESRRIDNQLRGRSGRQGDPGESQFFVSMEDQLMRLFGSDRIKRMMEVLGVPDDMPIENGMISRSIESAQKKVEGHNFDIRKHLVEYDDVMNKHREIIYSRRRKILFNENIKNEIIVLIEKEVESIVLNHIQDRPMEEWNYKEIFETINAIHRSPIYPMNIKELEMVGNQEELISVLKKYLFKEYEEREKLLPNVEIMRNVEKAVYLRAIDTLWMEHIDAMHHLRDNVALEGYGQRDPLIIYKEEAFKMLSELLASIQTSTVNTLFKISIEKEAAPTIRMGSARSVIPAKAGIYHSSVIPTEAEGSQNLRTNVDEIKDIDTGDRELTPNNPVVVKVGGGSSRGGKSSLAGGSSSVISTERTTRASGEISPPVIPAQAGISSPKVGRNDPCPCGSGKKYKKCCGK